MGKILTVTLNPAVDVAASIARLVDGPKLRCSDQYTDPGGGGVNVSRAIKKLGGESTPFIAIGGPTGDLLLRLLQDEGIEPARFTIDALTRQSFAITEKETGKQYRFVLPGPKWPNQLWRAAFDHLIALTERDGIVVLSGSLPPGIPDDFYSKVVERLEDMNAKIIVDTSGSALASLLKEDETGIYCLRLNWKEAQQLSGLEFHDLDDAYVFANELVGREIAKVVVITQGANGAIVTSRTDAFQITPPVVEINSAVGAGDSFVGAFALGMSKGWPLSKMSAFGVAAAASAMTTAATELCERSGTLRYFEEIAHENFIETGV